MKQKLQVKLDAMGEFTPSEGLLLQRHIKIFFLPMI